MRRYIMILAALMMLSVAAISLAEDADASDPKIIGIGLDEYGQTEYYTMDAIYYEGDLLSMVFTCSLPEIDPLNPGDTEIHSSEIDHAVYIVLRNADTDAVISTSVHPVKMTETLEYENLNGQDLEDGLYKLEIQDLMHVLVIGVYLYVGEVHEIEFKDTEGQGSIEPNDPIIVPHNTEMVLEDNKMTFTYSGHSFAEVVATPPEGFSFGGWYSAGVKINSGDKVAEEMTDEKQIEARWSCEYILHFDANGGTGAPDDMTYVGPESSHTFTIPSTKPTKSGQEFKGWSESATGSAQYQPGATITLQLSEPEKTLYAVWGTPPVPPGPTDVYTYRVTYDANGGSGAPEAQTITTSAFRYLFTVPDTIPVKDGYRFDGWSETNPGTVKYVPGDTIELQYTAPLLRVYAVWETEGPAIKEIISEVDLLDLAVGDDVTFDVTTVPAGKESSLIWTTSDPTVVVIADDGSIKAVGTGTATITISSPDGKTTLRIPVTVTSEPSPQQAKKVIHTDNGGSVVVYFHADSEGKLIPTNPVEINPGADGNISKQQYEIADSYMTQILRSGVLPDTIVYGREQNMIIPAELLESVAVDGGSLTVEFYDEVRITLSAAVISELGYGEDIELIVIPVAVESEDLPDDIDVSGLGDDVKVYDIYMTRNGERITRTLDNGIGIGIGYPLEDGRTPEKVHLYYIDVDPFEEYAFIYQDDAVNFTVHHFSHYAIAYDAEKNDLIIWIGVGAGILVLLLIFILLFLFVLRKKIRLDLDGGTYVFVPEGWKSESSSVIYRRFKKGDELVIPKVDARKGGATVTGWLPDPPKEVEKSETFKAVWSNQNDL